LGTAREAAEGHVPRFLEHLLPGMGLCFPNRCRCRCASQGEYWGSLSMNGQALAALITAGATLLSALLAAAVSIATLIVSQRTRREVEKQAREQAEHEVVFEGIYAPMLQRNYTALSPLLIVCFHVG